MLCALMLWYIGRRDWQLYADKAVERSISRKKQKNDGR